MADNFPLTESYIRKLQSLQLCADYRTGTQEQIVGCYFTLLKLIYTKPNQPPSRYQVSTKLFSTLYVTFVQVLLQSLWVKICCCSIRSFVIFSHSDYVLVIFSSNCQLLLCLIFLFWWGSLIKLKTGFGGHWTCGSKSDGWELKMFLIRWVMVVIFQTMIPGFILTSVQL